MIGGKLHLGTRGRGAWVLLLALAACTDPAERPTPVRVSIDADTIVRLNTVRVEIRLEAQLTDDKNHASKTWDTLLQQTFRPDPMLDTDWPWELGLEPAKSNYARYNLTAIARDAADSVLGRVQLVRDLAQARRYGLRVRFDSECFRHEECAEGSTCSRGKCVDAAASGASPAAEGGAGAPAVQDPRVATQDVEGVALEGSSCKEGQRACATQGSRKPLACEGSVWRAQPDCQETERCNTSDGPDRGACQPIAGECMNRQANVPYCDGETMRVCVDLVGSQIRSCSENERCVPEGAKAKCDCRPGFVRDKPGTPCARAKECGQSAGGCDPLTLCSMVNGKPACSTCPPGYTGSGEKGCAPLLQNLALSAGTLEPALDENVLEYRANLPLLAQTVELTPTMPPKTTVTLNGAKLASDGSWTSPMLELGKATHVELVLTSEFGVSRKYTITLERTGEQLDYVKPTGSGSYDQFGSAIDISGDTMLVGAWFQDAGATINGAAYVYSRDGDKWKRTAELRAGDLMDYDYFGTSLDLDGDTIVVGAIKEGLFDANTGPSKLGNAYVFTRSAGKWTQTQELSGAPQDRSDLFGAMVVLSGDRLVVGAPWESTTQPHSGAVYVYQRDASGKFNEVQKIKSTKPTANARFGWNIALDGERMVVGAPDDPPPHNRPGAAEVFALRDGSWKSSQFLQPTMLGGAANFGFAVAVRGDRVAISAPRSSAFPGSPTPTEPGEVYVFGPDGEGWKQTAVLHAPHPRNTDWFGLSMLLTDAGLIIGAPGDTSGAHGLAADPKRTDAAFSGAVHMFAPTADGWTETAFFKGENTDINDWFGYALATDGQSLMVSALFENAMSSGLTTGGVYVFH
ncbi:MAG TPA: cadherin-like beta sandwich domain-containing protein [Polyangiales bacterium]|nr:cadherin-like beta sandwich domain-containing protein [Polyangiales bacterium]